MFALFKCQTVHSLEPIKCYHSQPEWTWERWQWKGSPHHYWSLTIRLFSVPFWTLVRGGHTSLQRCSWCILQLQLAGFSSIYKSRLSQFGQRLGDEGSGKCVWCRNTDLVRTTMWPAWSVCRSKTVESLCKFGLIVLTELPKLQPIICTSCFSKFTPFNLSYKWTGSSPNVACSYSYIQSPMSNISISIRLTH